MDTAQTPVFPHAQAIAQSFVEARLNADSFASYPGPLPPDLASAYACQNAAIEMWPDKVAGWKIGKIPDEQQLSCGGITRLAGPIFAHSIVHAEQDNTEVTCGVFLGGSACLEGEFIFEIAHDAPEDKFEYTQEEASQLAGRLLVGIEMAGSPLANINAQGCKVVISDFGNNADEIVGTEIPDWRSRKWEDLKVETYIEDRLVGRGSAANIPGSPLESLQFIAGNTARRGMPLKKGQIISTGAATGVHDILVGQKGYVVFDGIETIRVATRLREKVAS